VNAELEHRVALRTDELTRANRQLEAEVTEHRRTENELRQTQSELVQASKLAALGQMSAGLSHELNQPLAAIRSYADNARKFMERERYETANANLGLIVELTERMARIIRHLRTYARKEPTTVRPTHVLRAIEDSITLLARRIEASGARVEVDVPAPDAQAIAGEVRLQQVMVNLISNALDAMAGSAEKQLTIRVVEIADAVVITVADTGPGIPHESMSSVFDPFFTTKEVGAGLGLGLSITYGIVKQFGGTIGARNAERGGAVFEVRLLPARIQAENAA
jgi:two-component system C4-dicarboxylate transport sensor histidine kinase DctB